MASSPENSTISTYNLHLVRHPVAVEVFQHTRCEEFVHLPQKAAGGAQHPHVGQDLSLNVQDRRRHALAGAQGRDVVGEHSLEPPDAVGSGHGQKGLKVRNMVVDKGYH